MSGENPITRALLTTIRHSDRPMVLSDPSLSDHPIIAVNPAFEALSGYSSAESVGRNCRFLQGPGTDPATARRVGRCLAERRGCIEWIVNHRRDGTAFWNLLFVSPVFDHDGTLLHFFGNQRDITDGRPNGVPDHGFGKSDMPPEARRAFHDALLDVLYDAPAADDDAADRARGLERVMDAVRRIDEATMALLPAPWTMPR